MSIIVKGTTGGTYTPHPEGQYPAVCVDVVDLGWMRTTFGPKYKIRISFFCGEWTEKDIDGEIKKIPLTVSEMFTASLHEKANLRQFAKKWRGADFTDEEVNGGFDFERMVGAPAFIDVQQVTKGDKTYANVASIMRLPQGMHAPGIPADYQRVKDREGWEGPAPHPDEIASRTEPDPSEPSYDDDFDSDLPF